MSPVWCMWLVVLAGCVPGGGGVTVVRVGLLSRSGSIPYAGVPFQMAVDNLRMKGHLKDIDFEIIAITRGCRPLNAVSATVDLVEKHNVDVIFGFHCSPTCVVIDYYLAKFRVAHYPTGCATLQLNNKRTFSTVIRVFPTYQDMGRAFLELFLHFSWNRTAIFQTERLSVCEVSVPAVRAVLQQHGVHIAEWIKDSNGREVADDTLLDVLARIRDRARVVVLCHYSGVINRLLQLADGLGMTNGDYVYLFAEKQMPNDFNRRPWHYNDPPWPAVPPPEKADQHRRIYTSIKFVTMAGFHENTTEAFLREVELRYRLPPWNISLPVIKTETYEMFAYDAATLYMLSLEAVIKAGDDYRDGTTLFENARGRQFDGVTGNVVLNQQADRSPHFWAYQLNDRMDGYEPFVFVNLSAPQGQAVDLITSPKWGSIDSATPLSTPECGFRRELCPEESHTTRNIIIAASIIGFLVLCSTGLLLVHRRWKLEHDLKGMAWRIGYESLQFLTTKIESNMVSSRRSMMSHATSVSTVTRGCGPEVKLYSEVAQYRGVMVAVTRSQRPTLPLTRDVLMLMKEISKLSHENVNPVLGACVDAPHICVVRAYCPKGSLQDVLFNDDLKLDWMFKSSLITDLINGMCYIHNSPLHSHGRLNSLSCLVDARWVLKLSGYGLTELLGRPEGGDDPGDLLWTSPELLRLSPELRPPMGTPKADVYSFAMIMQEIVFRAEPFFGDLSYQEVIDKLTCRATATAAVDVDCNKPIDGNVPYRPTLPEEDTDIMTSRSCKLIALCWEEDPLARPSFEVIRKSFRQINGGKKLNIMDNMILILEKYASNLEEIVTQRTCELVEEKKKTDRLLYSMLPRAVAEQLKQGKPVAAELFDDVTIYFSDIVGFTSLSSQSSPFQIIDLLNDLYTLFDHILEKFDVYKVETIGDAYMVVSGLPKRNGQRHVAEIADMSLALLEAISKFRVRHQPDYRIKLRIGLHTGPCAAGVVGLAMPRYCLFGDTVNTASRMESTGEEALMIHVSETMQLLLEGHSEYILEYRGETTVKGKGMMKTYWLSKTILEI